MPKPVIPTPPHSPVMTTVIDDFIAKAAADEIIGKDRAERLRAALVDQRDLDVDTLRAALFESKADPA